MHTLNNITLWTAIVTPLDARGQLDLASLRGLLLEQQAAGNGVILLGSTGEGSNLTLAERKAVLTYACSLQLDMPLLAGVGGLELASQLEWLAFCETLPLAGYLLVTPIYAKPGAHGQAGWFRALLDATRRPCMLYNIPSRAGVPLSAEALELLRGHGSFWAVKDSGGDVAAFSRLRLRFPEIAWYSGDDVFFGEFAAHGAAGLVSVASNVWPQQVANWVREGLAGEGERIGPLLREVAEPLFSAANPIPAKALLQQQGRIVSGEVRLPLSTQDLPSLAPLLAVDAWMRA